MTVEIQPSELLKKIRRATDPACETALKYFGKVQGELKPDKTYMTEADTEIETLLMKKLPKIIEGSVVVGEETAPDRAATRELKRREFVWVIDPIDGTASFIDGLPMFCICVGLMRAGELYAGVLRFPATGEIYEAVRGYGAFYNGKRIRIDAKTELRHEAPIYVPPKAHLKYKIAYTGKTRSIGSAAAHVAMVSRGAALASVANAYLWDFAAAAAILTEAGGELRYLDGKRVNWPSLIASREKLRMPVLAAERSRWRDVASMIKFIGK